MPRGRDASEIEAQASRLVASGAVGDAQLRVIARIGRALPVLTPERVLQSWFVPLTVGEILAAFMQLLPDGTLMRFSSFQRRPGDLTGCPDAADWLDVGRIGGRVKNERRPDETIGEPFLTYDGNPDRLVWSVPLVGSRGDTRHVYVAGAHAFTPPPSGGVGS